MCLLSYPVIATIPNTPLIPTSPSTSEDTQTSGTDLEEINMEDEINTDTSKWLDKERKKLQHMKEFHGEYQRLFGGQALLCTIIRKRIAHMSPPISHSVCDEEMQDASLDTKEVIIEYITDAHGNKVKKLKPLLIKSEPNRTYIQHIPSDDELPVVPEDKFIQRREITVDSYSGSISSDDEASDDRTVTADSDSSAAQSFEDTPCKLETDAAEIEATLNQIASGFQSATEGYLALASHLPKLKPYELPQIIAQIPPPSMNVPMPIRKAFSTEGENKTIHYLLHGEYELTNTSWSRLQQKYNGSCNTLYTILKGKGRPGGSQYQQKRKRSSKQETIATSSCQRLNNKVLLYCRYTIYHDDLCIEWTCVFLWKYSFSMGYATTSLYIQNSFVTPSPK